MRPTLECDPAQGQRGLAAIAPAPQSGAMDGPTDQIETMYQTRQMGLRVIMDATGVDVLLITCAERVMFFSGDTRPGEILVITASDVQVIRGAASLHAVIVPGQVIGVDGRADAAAHLAAGFTPRKLIDLGPRIAAQMSLT